MGNAGEILSALLLTSCLVGMHFAGVLVDELGFPRYDVNITETTADLLCRLGLSSKQDRRQASRQNDREQVQRYEFQPVFKGTPRVRSPDGLESSGNQFKIGLASFNARDSGSVSVL